MQLSVVILHNLALSPGLSMGSNKMKNLQQLEPLVEKIPELKELKLAGNNFRCWDDVKVRKFKLRLNLKSKLSLASGCKAGN